MKKFVCIKYYDREVTRTISSGKNVKDLFHVAIGGGCCLLWIAAALTRAQIGRIPVPPVMLGVCLLEVVVVLCRFAQEPCQGCNIHVLWSRQVHSRPGRRVLISWSSQPFPSGSSNEANE